MYDLAHVCAVVRALGTARSDTELAAHGLAAMVAVDQFAQGLDPSPVLREAALTATQQYLGALLTIDSCAAELAPETMIIKGVEVASYYPEPSVRSSSDVDLLAPAAEAQQQRLIDRCGAKPVLAASAYVTEHHHLPPLGLAGHGLAIEVHSRLGLERWMAHPPIETLVERSAASRAMPALRTLDPVDHLVYLAVHHWHSGRFSRLRDLIDLAVMLTRVDAEQVRERAQEWHVARIWKVAEAAVASLLDGTADQWRDPNVSCLGSHHGEYGVVRRYRTLLSVAPPVGAVRQAMEDVHRFVASTSNRTAAERSPQRDAVRRWRHGE